MKANNNYKFWQIVQKEFEDNDKTQTYFSLESGKIMKSEDGNIFFEFPKNRVSLPRDENILSQLCETLNNLNLQLNTVIIGNPNKHSGKKK